MSGRSLGELAPNSKGSRGHRPGHDSFLGRQTTCGSRGEIVGHPGRSPRGVRPWQMVACWTDVAPYDQLGTLRAKYQDIGSQQGASLKSEGCVKSRIETAAGLPMRWGHLPLFSQVNTPAVLTRLYTSRHVAKQHALSAHSLSILSYTLLQPGNSSSLNTL